MACPLYSKLEQECLLLDQIAVEDEEDAAPEAGRLRHDFCLGEGKEYLACPVFRRCTVERGKAY